MFCLLVPSVPFSFYNIPLTWRVFERTDGNEWITKILFQYGSTSTVCFLFAWLAFLYACSCTTRLDQKDIFKKRGFFFILLLHVYFAASFRYIRNFNWNMGLFVITLKWIPYILFCWDSGKIFLLVWIIFMGFISGILWLKLGVVLKERQSVLNLGIENP